MDKIKKKHPDLTMKHFVCTYKDKKIEIMARFSYHAQMAASTDWSGNPHGKINPRDIDVRLCN